MGRRLRTDAAPTFTSEFRAALFNSEHKKQYRLPRVTFPLWGPQRGTHLPLTLLSCGYKNDQILLKLVFCFLGSDEMR